MKNALRDLIEAYISKAAELVPRLLVSLGSQLPITNNEWVALRIPQSGMTSDGLIYFKHGYGVAIEYDGGELDIDFGDQGQYDGFDAWRLFSFAMEGKIQTPYKNHREIEADIKDAESKGQLRYSGYILYYLCNES